MMNDPRRGAVRHWLLGCGIIGALAVAAVLGAGYFLFQKVGATTFSTASKGDPSAGASRDVLLPPKEGSYNRTDMGSVWARSTTQSTSGSQSAVYEDAAAGKLATVVAISTTEAHKMRGQNAQFGSNSQGTDMGFGMKMPFGPEKMEMAFWAKKNWSYMVQTTDTSAVKFAQDFQPGTEGK